MIDQKGLVLDQTNELVFKVPTSGVRAAMDLRRVLDVAKIVAAAGKQRTDQRESCLSPQARILPSSEDASTSGFRPAVADSRR